MLKILAVLALSLAPLPLAQSADLQADLLARERAMWTAWGKKDAAPFKKQITADAVLVVAGTTPAVGRDAIVKTISGLACELKSFSFADGRVRKLGGDVVAVSYTATQDASCEGKKLPPKVYSTAIYVKRNGQWMQTHYQETPLQ